MSETLAPAEENFFPTFTNNSNDSNIIDSDQVINHIIYEPIFFENANDAYEFLDKISNTPYGFIENAAWLFENGSALVLPNFDNNSFTSNNSFIPLDSSRQFLEIDGFPISEYKISGHVHTHPTIASELHYEKGFSDAFNEKGKLVGDLALIRHIGKPITIISGGRLFRFDGSKNEDGTYKYENLGSWK